MLSIVLQSYNNNRNPKRISSDYESPTSKSSTTTRHSLLLAFLPFTILLFPPEHPRIISITIKHEIMRQIL